MGGNSIDVLNAECNVIKLYSTLRRYEIYDLNKKPTMLGKQYTRVIKVPRYPVSWCKVGETKFELMSDTGEILLETSDINSLVYMFDGLFLLHNRNGTHDFLQINI